MKGLPPDLNQQLRQTLFRCGPFDSNEALRRVFVDARVRPWAGLAAEADTRQDRIDNIIALLYEQKASQTQENALALFLLVLSERRQPGDACRQELAALARQVASYAGSGDEDSDEQIVTPRPSPDRNIIDNQGVIIEGPVTGSTITVGAESGQHNLLWLILVVVVIISMGVGFLVWRNSQESNAVADVRPPGSTVTLVTTLRPTSSLPAAAATPLPQLIVFPALAEQKLRDAAAANGHVWFATEEGLFHYETAAAGEPEQVTAAMLEVVAAAPGGTEVWFSAGETGGAGKIGRYRLGETDVTWLPPSASGGLVTAMQIDADGILWFGDIVGNLFQLRPGEEQPQLLPPPASSPIIHVYDLALAPGQAQTVWLVGASFVYRWQADGWVDSQDGSMVASGVINAVAGDGQGRAWFGHAAGVTVYKTSLSSNLRQECPVADLDSQLVTDVGVGNAGTELWVITESGLARLDVSPETLNINNCASWVWQTFIEDSFWQPDPHQPAEYRLTIDEAPNGQTSAIWIVRRNTGKIRRLPWPSN